MLSATNGASRWDLNSANIDFNRDATINFNSKNNALVRKSGTHTAFVHFSNATPKGYRGSALYASIGITSSGDGIDSASSGRFCGVRFSGTLKGYSIQQRSIKPKFMVMILSLATILTSIVALRCGLA